MSVYCRSSKQTVREPCRPVPVGALLLFVTLLLLALALAYFGAQVEPLTPALTLTEQEPRQASGYVSSLIRARIVQEDAEPALYYTVYEVREGDVVGRIAQRYDISQDAIISLNKLRSTRALQVGQLLKIPSVDGILYTVKNGDTFSSIAAAHQISLERLVLLNTPSSSKESPPSVRTLVSPFYNSAARESCVPFPFSSAKQWRENTSFDAVQPLQPARVLFLPGAHLSARALQEINGDLFRAPLRSRYYVSSRYGWRSDPFTGARSFHNGLDMVSRRGTPVYSALGGIVRTVGYSAVYGNYLIVGHHAGYQTLYGHLQTVLVSAGTRVTSATKIGLLGKTGRSTGPHLHFTIYKNGSAINPTSLLRMRTLP